MPRHVARLGWNPDLPDHRDRKFSLAPPTSLPPSADLRAGMPPVYDQGQLGCHDEDTEVLTERGWQRWADYDGEALLGTVNPASKLLEMQAPTALHAYEYDGPMFYSNHRSLDFGLTPNHRMWVRKWNEAARTLETEFRFVETQDLGWYAGLLAAPVGHVGVELGSVSLGRRIFTGDEFLALVALVVSDGWVGGTEHNWNTVSFCCFREDRRTFVERLAADIGFGEVPGRRGVWKATDPALADWFRANAYVGQPWRSPNKHIPELVRAASQRQIEHFLRFFGDQSVSKRGARYFYTSSGRLADDLQELLLRVGHRGSMYERAPRSTVMRDGRRIDAEHCTRDITIVERQTDRLSLEKKAQVEVERYKGGVFCASVPNGLLVTRRHGSVLVSGNSCTANAIAAALEYDAGMQAEPMVTPSRLFIYFNERDMEGTVGSDSGAMIRDGIKSVNQLGAPPEDVWPYDISQLTTRPPQEAYDAAGAHKALVYEAVSHDLDSMRVCLAGGRPFVFGFSVYESFESAEVAASGVVPMPGADEQQVGGHAVLAVGYDSAAGTFLVRNSWGDQWGQQGHFVMPFAYLTNPDLSDDFWVIRTVA